MQILCLQHFQLASLNFAKLHVALSILDGMDVTARSELDMYSCDPLLTNS